MKRTLAALGLVIVSSLFLTYSVLAANPMAGDWSFALTFGDTRDQEAHNVYIREDGYGKSADWKIGGNWSRPDAFTLNITGQGNDASFSATSVTIAEDYTKDQS